MILNPKYLLNNDLVTYADHINIDKHVQQNGIDVDCIELFELDGALRISEDHKEGVGRTPVTLSLTGEWLLKKGCAYEFNSSFEARIPSKMGGSVVGRSTFNRSGILIRSSWFDTGFKGNIGGTIYCFNDCYLTKGTRVGQFIMHEANEAGMYNGQYQSK